MKTNYPISRIIITCIVVLCSLTTKTFAQVFPDDFFPQAGQVEEWTVSALNELQFDGGQPPSSPAIIATTFCQSKVD